MPHDAICITLNYKSTIFSPCPSHSHQAPAITMPKVLAYVGCLDIVSLSPSTRTFS